ncbi:hypothetical protein ES702_00222 [subsurface metagenome]
MLFLPFLTAGNALEHLGTDENKSSCLDIFSVSVMQWSPPERHPIVLAVPRSCGAIYSILQIWIVNLAAVVASQAAENFDDEEVPD